jgi:hypothetical protein
MLQKIKEYGSFDPTEATWEDQDMVQVQFPEFFLGDKKDVRGEKWYVQNFRVYVVVPNPQDNNE